MVTGQSYTWLFSPALVSAPTKSSRRSAQAGWARSIGRVTHKLDRDVAIKILPQAFVADADRVARFQREAKVLASLNHPHIAAIYGLEEADGVKALVIELVEGLTLADRIAQGPIPVDETLAIAKQIAEALEAAHEQRIIHRDLKPANIKLRPDGTVKVLDFGLAKALEPVAATSGDVTASPTITTPAMTQMGVILGTAAYMAPEQAKGTPADKRSDVWAFGCVLYEMLTGRRAFDGENVTDTMANVLMREPSWDRVPGTTPPAVGVLLRRCLRRDRRQRLQDGASVRLELEDALSAPLITQPAGSRSGWASIWHRVLGGGLALLAGAVIGGLAMWNLKPSPRSAPQAVARLVVTVPADEELLVPLRGIAVSPNGAHLVYVARRRGVQQLHVRPIDSLQSRSLAGTEGGLEPFFSPDSQSVGFFAQGKLKRIAVAGGAPQTMCDAGPQPMGGTWAPNDVIYFAPEGAQPGCGRCLREVALHERFANVQGAEISLRWPQVLPGGQAVLFTSRTGPGADEHQVQVQRVPNGERRILAQGESGSYIPSGHLVYVRSTTGTLVAVPFDLTNLQVGAAAPAAVAEGILVGGEGAHYASSDSGLLAYVAGGSHYEDRTLVWVDRNGKPDSVNAPARAYEAPRLSPDGSQVAVMAAGATQDTWVINLARGDATRLIGEGSNQFPVWRPDGKYLLYRATRAGTRDLFWQPADGSGSEERLTTGEAIGILPGSWSPNGQVLLFSEMTPTGRDIVGLRFPDRTMEPFLRTRFAESAPAFSPDGRWVAYVSDESGRQEIYVRPYPGPGGKSPISTDGGTEPLWHPNGRELFYRNGDKLMAVEIATRPVFAAGKPKELFTGDYMLTPASSRNYDVSLDGRRFLMIQPSARHAAPRQIVVVLNWIDELKRLVPTR